MISVSIDTTEVEQALQQELQALTEFPIAMAEELTAWQTEDMKRNYPNTTTTQNTATTMIWPRSRLSEQRQAQRRQAMRQPNRRSGLPRPRGALVHSARPILREELFDQLTERMDELMVDKLGWPEDAVS
jgi:hypothetical protein